MQEGPVNLTCDQAFFRLKGIIGRGHDLRLVEIVLFDSSGFVALISSSI